MKTALVADDDPDVRALVTFKLERAGWTVQTAADGESALEKLTSARPDVAVLDVTMPKLSGLEVCREIRSRPELADLAVLILTARSQESDIERGFALGASDYLVKPFSPRELVSRLDALVGADARLTAGPASLLS